MSPVLKVILIGIIITGLLIALHATYQYMGPNTNKATENSEAGIGLLRYVNPGIVGNITEEGYRAAVRVNKSSDEIEYHLGVFPITGSDPIMALKLFNGKSPNLFDRIIDKYGVDYIIEGSHPTKLGENYWYWEYRDIYGVTYIVAGNNADTILIGYYEDPIRKDFMLRVIKSMFESLGHEYHWTFDAELNELINTISGHDKEKLTLIIKDPGDKPPY